MPSILRSVHQLEQLSLGLARLSEGELALVFTLFADQHAELQRQLGMLEALRARQARARQARVRLVRKPD